MEKEQVRVVAAVIEHEGRYLLTQRKSTAVLPLLWEFPGGRVETTESEEEALVREVKGRIGAEIRVLHRIGQHIHEYSAYRVQMTMFASELVPGALPTAAGVADLRWVASRDFFDYDFPPADETTMTKLLGLARN